MKNNILILLFCVLCSVVMAQQNKPARHIVTKDYEGYSVEFLHDLGRDSLTMNEIQYIENFIRDSLKIITKNRPELNYEFINRNYKNYIRQYWKFVDAQGDAIVNVRFVLNTPQLLKILMPDLSTKPFGFDSEGTEVWGVRVNLTQKRMN